MLFFHSGNPINVRTPRSFRNITLILGTYSKTDTAWYSQTNTILLLADWLWNPYHRLANCIHTFGTPIHFKMTSFYEYVALVVKLLTLMMAMCFDISTFY